MDSTALEDVVKEEEIMDLFEVKEETLEEIYPSRPCLENCPIVYTTRLDDMNIFKKDLTHLPSSTIINYIITESNPKVQNFIDKFNQNEGNNISKFMKLIHKLEQYNHKTYPLNNSSEISNETFKVKIEPSPIQDDAEDCKSSNIQRLVQLCKPLSVTLINCESMLEFRYCTKHKGNTSKSNNEIMKCKKCIKLYKIKNKCQFNTKQNDITKELRFTRLLKTNNRVNSNTDYGYPPLVRKLKTIIQKFNDICVVMRNFSLNNTEIYHFRIGTTTDYYRIGHVINTDDELSNYVKLPVIIEMSNCCSHKRYGNINNLLASFSPKKSLLFLPNRLSYLNSGETCKKCPNSQMTSSTKNLPTMDINSKYNNLTSLWQKFVTRTDSNNVNGLINKALNYARSENFKTQPQRVTAKVTKLPHTPKFMLEFRFKFSTQHCIVRNDGQIQSYLKANRLTTLNKTLFKLKDCRRYTICCWINHQIILSNYRSPVVDFLKNNVHHCPTGNCKCCCKNEIIRSPLNFKKMTLTDTFNHTVRYTTRLKEIYINVEKLRETTMGYCKLKCLFNFFIPCVGKLPKFKPKQVINKSTVQQQPTVNELITSVMQRFKHIKLSLSAEGKIQAILDTPATTFSNLELRILSKILEHAQEQVKDLGIAGNSNDNLLDPLNVCNLNLNSDSFYRRLTTELDIFSEIPSSDTGLQGTSNSDLLYIKDNKSLNETSEENSINNIKLENTETTVNNTTDLYNTYRNLTILQNEQIRRSFESFFKNRDKCKDMHSPLVPMANSSNETVMPSITKVFSLNSKVGSRDDSTEIKPKVKRSSETILQLGNFLTEKKPRLDIPSTLCQGNYTTDSSPGSVLQQKNSPVPNTLVRPDLVPVLIGNTDFVDSSAPKNQPLLPVVASPVVKTAFSQIPQSYIVLAPLHNTTEDDEECILGV